MHKPNMEGESPDVAAALGKDIEADRAIRFLYGHEDAADKVEIAPHRYSIPRA